MQTVKKDPAVMGNEIIRELMQIDNCVTVVYQDNTVSDFDFPNRRAADHFKHELLNCLGIDY